MHTEYNQIAGQNIERLAALSDGIFAVAMTLLVLDLRVPVRDAIHSEHELHLALLALLPRLLMYIMSFLTLGIFWVGQQTQLNHLVRGHRSLAWIHFVFLFAVSITPFSTQVLAEYVHYRSALLLYWLNVLLLGVALNLSWRCAIRLHLVDDRVSHEIGTAIKRRILVAQVFYALGASLCFVNTYLSIAFIILVQLNYAMAPKLRRAAVSKEQVAADGPETTEAMKKAGNLR
jgi:uncharacterized membrane protein